MKLYHNVTLAVGNTVKCVDTQNFSKCGRRGKSNHTS